MVNNDAKTIRKMSHQKQLQKLLPRQAEANIGTKLKIKLPSYFSLKKNIALMDDIESATSVYFNKTIFCICKDVSTADSLFDAFEAVHFKNNKISRKRRLGQAYCAYMSKGEVLSNVLTVVKLNPNTTNADLRQLFPEVVDISTKKTMAKLVFSDAKTCLKATEKVADLDWPHGAKPTVSQQKVKKNKKHNQVLEDPDMLKFGYPQEFVNNPLVVAIDLVYDFNLMLDSDMLVLLKVADEILLSTFLTAVYADPDEAARVCQRLRSQTVDGEAITCRTYLPLSERYAPSTDADSSSQEDEEEASDEEGVEQEDESDDEGVEQEERVEQEDESDDEGVEQEDGSEQEMRVEQVDSSDEEDESEQEEDGSEQEDEIVQEERVEQEDESDEEIESEDGVEESSEEEEEASVVVKSSKVMKTEKKLQNKVTEKTKKRKPLTQSSSKQMQKKKKL